MDLKVFAIILVLSTVHQSKANILDTLFHDIKQGIEDFIKKGPQIIVNGAIDFIIARAKADLKDTMKMPDAAKDFPLGTVHMRLEKGLLYGLSSVERAADYEQVKDKDGKIVATVPLQFTDIQVVYNRYDVNYTMLLLHDRSTGRAVTDKINVTATAQFVFGNSICDVEAKNVKFKEMKNFNVTLIPDQGKNPITNFIFNEVLGVFNSLIKGAVQKGLTNQIYQVVKSLQKDCSQ